MPEKVNTDLDDVMDKTYTYSESPGCRYASIIISGITIECNRCGKRERVRDIKLVANPTEKPVRAWIGCGECRRIYMGFSLRPYIIRYGIMRRDDMEWRGGSIRIEDKN